MGTAIPVASPRTSKAGHHVFSVPAALASIAEGPTLYSVTKPYYDFLGVTAKPITEGILIPWEADQLRGTIWAVSHTSEQAFERADYELLKSLSDYVAVIIRQQKADEKAKR